MAHANLTPADVRRYLHPEPDTGAIVDAVMKALGIDDESVRDTVNQAVRGVLRHRRRVCARHRESGGTRRPARHRHSEPRIGGTQDSHQQQRRTLPGVSKSTLLHPDPDSLANLLGPLGQLLAVDAGDTNRQDRKRESGCPGLHEPDRADTHSRRIRRWRFGRRATAIAKITGPSG